MQLREYVRFGVLVIVAAVATFSCLNFFIAIGEPSLVLSQPPPLVVVATLALVAIAAFMVAPSAMQTLEGMCNGMLAGLILFALQIFASNSFGAELLKYRLFWHGEIYPISWWTFAFIIIAVLGGFVSGVGFAFGRKYMLNRNKTRI